jgi:hypothetical protein
LGFKHCGCDPLCNLFPRSTTSLARLRSSRQGSHVPLCSRNRSEPRNPLEFVQWSEAAELAARVLTFVTPDPLISIAWKFTVGYHYFVPIPLEPR